MRVLDLFGGTGAVGIEALSRGADHVTFIDLDRRAIQTLRTNVENCGFSRQAQIVRDDSFKVPETLFGRPFRSDLCRAAPV